MSPKTMPSGASGGACLGSALGGGARLERGRGLTLRARSLVGLAGCGLVGLLARGQRQAQLFLVLRALASKLRGPLLRSGGLRRLAGERLLGGDARLQDGGGARLGLGALARRRFAAPLGLEPPVQLGRSFGFRLFALARGAQRLRVGFAARLGATAQLGVER